MTNRLEAPFGAVIITRPMAQATQFAGRVSSLGMDAILFPLLEIHPLADPAPLHMALGQLNQYGLVVFVSPNAIDATFAHLTQRWPEGLTIAVIGDGSRTTLAAHGINAHNVSIVSPRSTDRMDSEALLNVLSLDALRGRKILIIRGQSGRELLADRMREQGFDVTQVAAYCRNAPAWTVDRRKNLEALLEGKHQWIVTSSEALRNLVGMVRLLGDVDFVSKMQQQRMIVSHPRIAEIARNEGFLDVLLSGSGDERLLDALQSSL